MDLAGEPWHMAHAREVIQIPISHASSVIAGNTTSYLSSLEALTAVAPFTYQWAMMTHIGSRTQAAAVTTHACTQLRCGTHHDPDQLQHRT